VTLPVLVEVITGPVWWRWVCRWIAQHHRHHEPPCGWRYGLAAWRGREVVGVAVIGRAVARGLVGTAEVTRCCTFGSSRKRWGAASALYRAAAEREPKIITYTLASETGASLVAAGWVRDGDPRPPRRWSCPSRPRRARRDEGLAKQRWRPGSEVAA
jgi:hypothetical protein